MVQNLRSRLSQAAAYPGLGVYTRINSSFRVLCTPRLIFSRINGPIVLFLQKRSFLHKPLCENLSELLLEKFIGIHT